jgi:hypothetical protein
LALFYWFYPMRAEGRIADRHEAYFANDAAPIAAARNVIEDFPRLEIWCGARQVASFAREDLLRRQPPRLTWAVVLITRNKRLLHQAAQVRRRSEALRARQQIGRRSALLSACCTALRCSRTAVASVKEPSRTQGGSLLT